jgi:predicted signal transduction protein with EAL and GGDEF domain
MEVIERPEAKAVVGAIIELGHSLGMRITAEGVESREQLEHLVAKGCDEAQGFLISRPVGPQQVPVVIAEQTARKGGKNRSIQEVVQLALVSSRAHREFFTAPRRPRCPLCDPKSA